MIAMIFFFTLTLTEDIKASSSTSKVVSTKQPYVKVIHVHVVLRKMFITLVWKALPAPFS